jgi:Txe/YoeB family toxin of Txe-Axe toxin-antitoxin module
MAYRVIYKVRFRTSLVQLLFYLESEWGKGVADQLLVKLEKRIERLKLQPFTGIRSEKVSNVRSVLVTYQNRLFYRVKGNTIEILNLYDTRRNPGTKRY